MASSFAAHRVPGYTLERQYYVSPEIFDLDIEKVFLKHWLYAGHESQIPNPGDYFTYDVAGESLIIVRQPDGSLGAFFNMCRHRGSRVMQSVCGNARALRCAYHNWTYGLDGTLKSAPGMLDQVCREELGLIPAWIESWHGLIYVHLDEARPAQSTTDLLRDAESDVAPFRFEDARIATTIVYNVPSNWKLFMENYRECYHCLANHPEFCATVPVARMSLHKSTVNSRIIMGPSLTFSNYPLRPGAKTQSLDGELVSIPFGDLTLSDPRFDFPPNYYLNYYPAHAFVFGIDYGMAFSLHPRSATETLLKVDWYVNKRAVEGRDYNVDALVAFWDVTHRQDVALCTMNQQGVNSRRYVPGPYSPVEEDDIEHLLNFYVSAISA